MRRLGVYLAIVALVGLSVLPPAPVVAGLTSDLPPGLTWADICNGDHGPASDPAQEHNGCTVCIIGACAGPSTSAVDTASAPKHAPKRDEQTAGYATERPASRAEAPLLRPLARGPPDLNG